MNELNDPENEYIRNLEGMTIDHLKAELFFILDKHFLSSMHEHIVNEYAFRGLNELYDDHFNEYYMEVKNVSID